MNKQHLKIIHSPKKVKTKNPLKKNMFVELLVFLVIALVFAAVYSKSFDRKLDLNGDNASYYLLAKSLSQGKGYLLANDLKANPHNHFPPGYPIILSFFMLLTQDVAALKLVNGLFLLLCAFLSYIVFKKFKVHWSVALVATVFMLVNYHLIRSSTILMSEIPFLFFATVAFYFFMKIDFSKEMIKQKTFFFFLFSLSFAFHIRTAGVALLAGIVFYLLFEKRWLAIFYTVVGFIFLAMPWALRNKWLGLKSSYNKQLLSINPYDASLGKAGLMDVVNRVLENATRYVTKEIPRGTFTFVELNYREAATFWEWVTGISILLLVAFAIYRLPKYRTLVFGYILGTFGVLLLWPQVWTGTRFLLPLMPLLIFLIVYGFALIMKTGLNFLNQKTEYTAILLLPFLLLFTKAYKPNSDVNWQSYPLSRVFLESKVRYQPGWKNYIELAKYAKTNLAPNDIISCRKPQMFHVFSDRYTCMFPYTADDKRFLQVLKERQVKYVVVDQLGYSSTSKYLGPAVNKNPRNFRVLKHLKNPDTYLLEFK